MTYDNLWESKSPQQSWLDKASTEQQEWLEGLADYISEIESEPVWRSVRQRFVELFGEDAAPNETTLAKHVRYLVGKRG